MTNGENGWKLIAAVDLERGDASPADDVNEGDPASPPQTPAGRRRPTIPSCDQHDDAPPRERGDHRHDADRLNGIGNGVVAVGHPQGIEQVLPIMAFHLGAGLAAE